MAEIMFPVRKRCRKCGKGLVAVNRQPVYLGLFCTPACAGMSESAHKPEAAPRGCRTQRDGAWVFKQRYRCEQEIPERLRHDPSTNWYWCTESCGHLHVGRTLVETRRADNRGLRSRSDIADLLLKSRGQASHKQLAAATGVRAIRIKEWEDPDFDSPSMGVLFALLAVYRIDLTAVFTPGGPGAPSVERGGRL